MTIWPKSRKARRRLTMVLVIGSAIIVALILSLSALRDTVVYFYGPSEITDVQRNSGQTMRLGGLVKPNSIARQGGGVVTFMVTDGGADISVTYAGVLPDLFREGQGVVAQGQFEPNGTFQAKTILAKHDENYMPREVKNLLRDNGQWRGKDPQPAPEQQAVP